MNVFQYIKNETDPNRLYDGVRSIMHQLDRQGRYPEDWKVKQIQRAADHRYSQLTKEENA